MPDWNDIANADDLPSGGRLCTQVGDKPIVVVNTEMGLYAVANQCPHAGRPMEDGEVQGLVITCPYHGYAYNLRNGKNLDFPEFEPPIPTYPVRIEAGKVQVAVSDPD